MLQPQGDGVTYSIARAELDWRQQVIEASPDHVLFSITERIAYLESILALTESTVAAFKRTYSIADDREISFRDIGNDPYRENIQQYCKYLNIQLIARRFILLGFLATFLGYLIPTKLNPGIIPLNHYLLLMGVTMVALGAICFVALDRMYQFDITMKAWSIDKMGEARGAIPAHLQVPVLEEEKVGEKPLIGQKNGSYLFLRLPREHEILDPNSIFNMSDLAILHAYFSIRADGQKEAFKTMVEKIKNRNRGLVSRREKWPFDQILNNLSEENRTLFVLQPNWLQPNDNPLENHEMFNAL